MSLNDIKKKLTDEQIVDFMKHLGSGHKLNNNNPNEIIFQTRCHNPKHSQMKYKLYYYKDSCHFHCFSSCGRIGDIYKLTEHILNLNQGEGVKYVLNYFNISTRMKAYTEEDYGFDIEEEPILISTKLEDIEVEHLPEIKQKNIMNLFIKYYCQEWLRDGISKETMDKYNIRYSIEQNAIVIPHYNIYGELVGVRVRNLNKNSIENFGKYTPLIQGKAMFNHKLSNNLYGLNHNKEAIQRFKKVQIFESEKAVLQLETMFNENNISVAICGSNFSRFTMKMLLDLGIQEFILCLDKEYNSKESEEKYKQKILRMCKLLLETEGITVSVVWDDLEKGLLEYKASPSDYGIDVFKKLVRNRIELKLEDKEGFKDDKI